MMQLCRKPLKLPTINALARAARSIALPLFAILVPNYQLAQVTSHQLQTAQTDWLVSALNQSESTTPLSPGKSHASMLHSITVGDTDPKNGGLHLVWAVFPKGSYTFGVHRVDKIGPANDLYTFATPENSLLTVNGGFYAVTKGQANSPLGLLIENGKQLSSRAKFATGGVIFSKSANTIEIVSIADFESHAPMTNAVQAKPLLIEKGRLAIHRDKSDSLFNRSAIGVTEDGALIVVGAFRDDNQAITLYDFGRFLFLLRTKKSVALKTVLNLDGATDAHIYTPATKLQLGYQGTNYVPDVITIGQR